MRFRRGGVQRDELPAMVQSGDNLNNRNTFGVIGSAGARSIELATRFFF